MKRLIKNIVVMLRLAKALKIYMPIDAIYKAHCIIPRQMQMESQGNEGEVIIQYTFAIMTEEAYRRKYKIDIEDYLGERNEWKY